MPWRRTAYARAQMTYATALMALGRYNLSFNGVTPASMAMAEPDPGTIANLPDLQALFGSLDYFQCEDCQSVYSPAAYLVDLLQFSGLVHGDAAAWRHAADLDRSPRRATPCCCGGRTSSTWRWIATTPTSQFPTSTSSTRCWKRRSRRPPSRGRLWSKRGQLRRCGARCRSRPSRWSPRRPMRRRRPRCSRFLCPSM